MNPIYVVSKGRPTSSTCKLLTEAGLDFTLVVEEPEAEDYARWESKLVVMSKTDQGNAYARQTALDHARESEIKYIWMLDDDIEAFYKTEKKRNVPVSCDQALAGAEGLLCGIDRIGIAGLEYQQFAWSAKRAMKFYSYCDVVVYLNTDVPVNYDTSFRLKVDRDYAISVLSAGYLTAKVNMYSFQAPKYGSNSGGCKEDYENERFWSERLVQKWGSSLVKLNIKKDGRPDAKINWAFFSQQQVA